MQNGQKGTTLAAVVDDEFEALSDGCRAHAEDLIKICQARTTSTYNATINTGCAQGSFASSSSREAARDIRESFFW